jgi:hypothetical protein
MVFIVSGGYTDTRIDKNYGKFGFKGCPTPNHHLILVLKAFGGSQFFWYIFDC